jgi:hypothetical protein
MNSVDKLGAARDFVNRISQKIPRQSLSRYIANEARPDSGKVSFLGSKGETLIRKLNVEGAFTANEYERILKEAKYGDCNHIAQLVHLLIERDCPDLCPCHFLIFNTGDQYNALSPEDKFHEVNHARFPLRYRNEVSFLHVSNIIDLSPDTLSLLEAEGYIYCGEGNNINPQHLSESVVVDEYVESENRVFKGNDLGNKLETTDLGKFVNETDSGFERIKLEDIRITIAHARSGFAGRVLPCKIKP